MSVGVQRAAVMLSKLKDGSGLNNTLVSGEMSWKELKDKVSRLKQKDVTDLYKNKIINIIERALAGEIIPPEIKNKLTRKLKHIQKNMCRVYEIEAIVKTDRDYMLGASDLDSNEIFLSKEMLTYLRGKELDEYLKGVVVPGYRSERLSGIVNKNLELLVIAEVIKGDIEREISELDITSSNLNKFSEILRDFKALYSKSPLIAGRVLGLLLIRCDQFVAFNSSDPYRLLQSGYGTSSVRGYAFLSEIGKFIVSSGHKQNIRILVDFLTRMHFEGLSSQNDYYDIHGRFNWQAEQVIMLLKIIAEAPEEKDILKLTRYITTGLILRGSFITENQREVFLTYEDLINKLKDKRYYHVYRQLGLNLLSTFSGKYGTNVNDEMRVRTRQALHGIGLLGEIRPIF